MLAAQRAFAWLLGHETLERDQCEGIKHWQHWFAPWLCGRESHRIVRKLQWKTMPITRLWKRMPKTPSMTLLYDLALSPGDNVSENPGFERYLLDFSRENVQ
jgi:hypothetical protein